MSDRAYQEQFKTDVYNQWDAGHLNVCGVMPTGSGKSHTAGEIVAEFNGYVTVIAHRQELVYQLSTAMARQGVHHQIWAPEKIEKFIRGEHLREYNVNYIKPNATVAVGGVDTIRSRYGVFERALKRTNLWLTDECHHIQRKNKWGTVCQMMPNAKGLGLTATPIRADGNGLSRDTEGLMDVMVEGPTMRHLIDAGFLTDYRIFAPPSDVDYSHVNIGGSGDYVPKQLKTAVRDSHLIGDVVQHYLRIAPGKIGVTFATDVETATDIARQFNAAGVPAEVVSAKTPDRERATIMRRLSTRQLLQVVNVDLLGEGVDCPAIEVVSMARRTQSYALYVQQFGRCLRLLAGKKYAIIIDHAGNVMLHGLPDKERIWSLDSREKRPTCKDPEDDIPLRYCVECTQPYSRTLKTCPWCGWHPVPASRAAPEHVDGDLHELSPDALKALRGARDEAMLDPNILVSRARFAGAPEVAMKSIHRKGTERIEIQNALQESIGWYHHIQHHRGKSESESYRTFYHLFGIDVLGAQALGRPDALVLADKINGYIGGTR